jgi:16S rRNA (uracil1498-N3)-methyltransferase
MTFSNCLSQNQFAQRIILTEPAAATSGGAPWPTGPAPVSALVMIGPEGGWSGAELAAAKAAGCVALTLGARTLRADAAPLVALSVLFSRWGDL